MKEQGRASRNCVWSTALRLPLGGCRASALNPSNVWTPNSIFQTPPQGDFNR